MPAILIFTRKVSDRMLFYAWGVSCVVQWVLCLPNGQVADSANGEGSPYGDVKVVTCVVLLELCSGLRERLGARSQEPPPPPQTKVTIVRKNEIYNRENLFLVHKLLGPRPPPPLF